jgi:predicted secreted hydrolase
MRTVSAWLLAWAALGAPAYPDAAGFALPEPGHVFHFPADHGSHPQFRLEWWYLTGHLYAGDRRFGFQATFFRQAGPDRSLQVQLAHMAILDVSTGRYVYQERLNAAGSDAGASTSGLDVFQGPWSLRASGDRPGVTLELRGGVRSEGRIALRLAPVKPLVVFGRDGVSRKGASPDASSYYLSFPRMTAEGELRLGGESFVVKGDAWMDHEISSNQVGAGLVGWDWAGIQLTDGREIMLYRLRRRDGSADPASTLTWVAADATTSEQAFSWRVESTWKSPATAAIYPSRVAVTTRDPTSGKERVFHLVPLADNQELAGQLGGIPYWEGACRVLDDSGAVVGSAYLELTGYAADLAL